MTDEIYQLAPLTHDSYSYPQNMSSQPLWTGSFGDLHDKEFEIFLFQEVLL